MQLRGGIQVLSIIAFALLFSHKLFAQEAQSICEYPEYAVDSSHDLTYESFRQKSWPRHTKSRPSFGWNFDIIWVRCTYLKQSDAASIIELAYPLLDDVQIFVEKDAKLIETVHVGDRVPNKGDVVDRVDPAFRLKGPAGSYTLIFRIESTSSKQIPVNSYSEQEFFTKEKSDFFINGAYVGIFLVMAVYNLFVFFSTQHLPYLLYAVFVIMMLLFQQSINGFTAEYFWPNYKSLSDFFISQGACLATFSALIFTIAFLQWGSRGLLWKRLGYILIGINSLAFFSSLAVPYVLGVQIIAFATLSSIPAMLVAAFYFSRSGIREAKFYLFAWSTVIIACGVYILKQLGFLPVNDFTVHSFKVGSMAEICLLSLALGDRLNSLKENLKLELRVRHMLVGELAHRMNNPLNRVNLGKENIEAICREQSHTLKEIFAAQDPQDPTVQQLAQSFEEQFDEIAANLLLMKKGMLKSIHCMTEIRALSGVDGYQLEYVKIPDLIADALEILEENIGEESVAKLQLNINSETDKRLLTQPIIAMMIIELILRNWIASNSSIINVQINLESIQSKTVSMQLSMDSLSKAVKNQTNLLWEQLCYLAKPYHISVKRHRNCCEYRLTFPSES